MPEQVPSNTAALERTVGELEVTLATVQLTLQNLDVQHSAVNAQKLDDSIANRIAMLSEPLPAHGPSLPTASSSRAHSGKCHCQHLDHLSVRVDNVVAELAKTRGTLFKHEEAIKKIAGDPWSPGPGNFGSDGGQGGA